MAKTPVELDWNELNVLAECLDLQVVAAEMKGFAASGLTSAEYIHQLNDAKALVSKLRAAQKVIA